MEARTVGGREDTPEVATKSALDATVAAIAAPPLPLLRVSCSVFSVEAGKQAKKHVKHTD